MDDIMSNSQAYADDIEMWGHCSADVVMVDGDNPATDFSLTPDEVRVMFTALRDYHAALEG